MHKTIKHNIILAKNMSIALKINQDSKINKISIRLKLYRHLSKGGKNHLFIQVSQYFTILFPCNSKKWVK